MNIWDDGNLKAIGAVKSKKVYSIKVDNPFVVTMDEQEKFFNFRSVLIRNGILCQNQKMEFVKTKNN